MRKLYFLIDLAKLHTSAQTRTLFIKRTRLNNTTAQLLVNTVQRLVHRLAGQGRRERHVLYVEIWRLARAGTVTLFKLRHVAIRYLRYGHRNVFQRNARRDTL